MLPFFTMPTPIFFDSLNVTSTLTSSSESKPYNLMFLYKEIQLILSRIEFSLLVRPSTTLPLSHVAPWGNELPTPGLVRLYLSSLIHWTCNPLNTRSQSWLSLYLPHVNTKLGKTAFCYKAAYIWNEVQKSLRLCSFISLREFSNLITCTTDFSCNDCNC